ncbi:MAG TPA: Calx-beta domain-containing protein [Solirubrobacteraceae bacterium]
MLKLRATFAAAALTALAFALPSTAAAQLPAGGIQQLPSPNDCVTTTAAECGTTINGGTTDARDVAVTPDGKSAYVVSSSGGGTGNTGSLATFARNPSTGALSFDRCVKDETSTEPCAANVTLLAGASSVIATNTHVYVASTSEDAVVAFGRNTSTGALTRIAGTTGCVSETGNGGTCEDGAGLDGVDFLVLSPDGENIYALSSSGGTIAVLVRNTTNGTITQPNPGTNGCYRGSQSGASDCGPSGVGGTTAGINNPVAADVSEDGDHVYVVSHDSGTLVGFVRDQTDGTLSFVECFRGTTSTDVGCPATAGGLNAPTDVEEVTSGGGHANVYVISGTGTSGLGSTIAEFDRDTGTGELTFDECAADNESSEGVPTSCTAPDVFGLQDATSITARPNDAQLYVTSRGDDAVAVLNRDQTDGDLSQDPDADDRCLSDDDTSTECATAADGITDVEDAFVSPDGVFLYTVSPADDAVAEFIIQAAPSCQNITVPQSAHNQPVEIPLQCTDPNTGDVLTYSVVSQPANGQVTISGSTATYTPNNGFTGLDSFTYRATDQAGNQSNTATVSVNIASAATPTLTIDDVTLTEDGTNAVFTVSASQAVTTVVSFTTENDTATAGSDYTAQSGTVTFTGQTSRTISVPILEDSLDELTERFRVRLTAATNGVAIADNVANGNIVDDDLATLSINDDTVAEDGGPATFTVSLSNPSTRTVSATYSTANGTATSPADYLGQSNQTVSFAPGETSKSVNVAVVDDAVVEQTETFSVVLGSPTGGSQLGDGTGQASILDDEQPSIAISDAAVAEGNADTRNATFTVTLSAPTTGATTVAYTTKDGTAVAGSDYTAAGGTLSFASGETTKTVSVPVIGDTDVESDETFSVVLSNPTNAAIGDGEGAGSIQNDDVASPPPPAPRTTMVISDSGLSEGDTGRRDIVFTVALSQAATGPVTVSFATGGGNATAGTDYVATRGTLAFNTGETTKTIAVPIIGDATFEPDETFGVGLSDANGADIVKAAGLGTIANDDIQRLLPRIEASARPARDRTRPYSFVVSGRIIRPAGVTAAQGCTGVVSIQYKAGGNTISNRRTQVNRACRFSRRTTFRNPRRLRNRNGRLTVSVRFQGNEYLLRRNASLLRVRAG